MPDHSKVQARPNGSLSPYWSAIPCMPIQQALLSEETLSDRSKSLYPARTRPVDQVRRGLLWRAGSIQVHGRKALRRARGSLPRQPLPGSDSILLNRAFDTFPLAQLRALTALRDRKIHLSGYISANYSTNTLLCRCSGLRLPCFT